MDMSDGKDKATSKCQLLLPVFLEEVATILIHHKRSVRKTYI